MNQIITTLSEIGEWGSGGTPLSSKQEYYNGSIPWLIIEDLNDDIVIKSQRSITDLGLNNSSAKIVFPNTLLIAMYGSIGKLGIAGITCSTNQAIAFCKLNQKIADIWYVFYYLLFSRPKLLREGRGNTQKNISQSFLKDYPIPLPSLPEQQLIAAILQKADRIRQLRRYARQLSDSYLQSVFLEMFGDPVTNPKGWKFGESEKIITNIRYGTGSPPVYLENGIPFIRATNVKNGTIQPDRMVFISKTDARKISKCELKAGDLLLVRSGVNSGDCALIPEKYHGAFAAYDLIIEMSFPYNYYFNFIINSDYGKQIISTLSRRAGQPHINSDQVKSIYIPYPYISLIEKFAKIIQDFEKLKAMQLESSRQSEHLFRSLLRQAFQGEL